MKHTPNDVRSGFFRIFRASLTAIILLGAAQATQAAVVAGATPGQFDVGSTGAASYSIPITVPPGIAGMTPSLALVYSSQSGNGLMGMGWNLSGLSMITRCPKTMVQDGVKAGVQYDATDRYCLDGQRLVAVNGGVYGAAGTEYRTERESYSKIISNGSNGFGPSWFKVWTKAGQIFEYGNTVDSAIVVATSGLPAGSSTTTPIKVWAVNKISDTKSNYLTVNYQNDVNANGSYNGQYMPVSIAYTGNATTGKVPSNKVLFVYPPTVRPDVTPLYDGGYLTQSTKLMTDVQTYATSSVGSALVKDYKLTYAPVSTPEQRSRLISLTECDGVAATALCISPTLFNWLPASNSLSAWNGSAQQALDTSACSILQMADVNGDGKADLVCNYVYFNPGNGDTAEITFVKLSQGSVFSGWQAWGPTSPVNSIRMYLCNLHQVIDVNGDGKDDEVCTYDYGTFERTFVKLSQGNTFTPWQAWGGQTPPGAFNLPNCTLNQMLDVNGDGLMDQVCEYDYASTGNAPYERTFVKLGVAGGLSTWQAWGGTTPSSLVFTPNCRLLTGVDLNGDGMSDILCEYSPNENPTTTDMFGNPIPDPSYGLNEQSYVKLSQGGGFTGWLSWGPRVTTGIFLASACKLLATGDVNGDGKPDVVCTYNDSANGIEQTYVKLNLGNSFTGWQAWGNTTPVGSIDMNNCAMTQLIDLNGDGKADLVCTYNFGGTTQQRTLAKISSGTSFSSWKNWSPLEGVSLASCLVNKMADVNGDGLPDQVCASHYAGPAEQTLVKFSTPSSFEVTNAFTNGLGAATNVTYLPLTNSGVYTKGASAVYPVMDLQMPMYVVSNTTSSNGIGGTFNRSYTYTGAQSQLWGGGFLGFAQVNSTDNNIGSSTTYLQDYPHQGLVNTQATYKDGTTNKLSYGSNTYAYGTAAWNSTSGGAQYFTIQGSQAKQYAYELANNGAAQGQLITASTTCNTMDTFGNATYVAVWSADITCASPPTKTGLYVKETTSTYAPADTVNWFLGRLTNSTVTSTTP